MNTIFRGRGIEIRVFPLSFSEYYSWRQTGREEAFDEYMKYGGMPYAALETDERYKQEYLENGYCFLGIYDFLLNENSLEDI